MNTNANINVQVTGIQALNQLQQKVAQTGESFSKLKSAIAGLALGTFITNAIKSAAALDDVASATGIALENIIAFSKAVKTFGGNFEGANTGIAKFSNFLQGAIDGNKKGQDSFIELGVSLDDLRTLSEQDLLRKTIKGLAEMDKGSKQTALGMDIFGKSFASVEFDKINNNLDSFIEKSRKQADAVRLAADAEERFGQATSALSNAVVQALRPLSDLIASIEPATLEKAASAIIAVATALGALYIASKAAAWATALSTALATMAITAGTTTGALSSLTAVLGLTSSLALFKQGIGLIKDGLFGVATAASTGASVISRLGLSFGALGAGLLRLIPFVGQVIAIFMVLNETVGLLTGSSIIEWGEKAAKAMGFIKETRKDTEEARLAQQKSNDEKANAIQRSRELQDALSKEKEQLKAIVLAYQRSNEEANKKFQLDTQSLRLSEAQKVLNEEQYSAWTKYAAEFNKLQDQINEKKASSSASDKAIIPQITASQGRLTAEYNKQKDAITSLVAERVKETQLKQLELFQTKEMIGAQDKLQGIQDDIAKSTLSEIERKYYDINAAAKASAKSAIEAEAARRGAPLSSEEQQKYYAIAAKGNEEIRAATEEQYVNSRRFATGWKTAFQEYAENATNAANTAQQIFQSLSKNLEDALYKFFTTGKLGWKEFANSIIQEMIRIQTKQLALNILTGGSGKVGASGSGALGLGGLFGFLAGGGPASANKPYIVGERGPELFVPNTSGTVIPNNALGGGGGAVTYNINAVDAMSFKQMLAQDPTFLHAVAEQGRRRLPGGR